MTYPVDVERNLRFAGSSRNSRCARPELGEKGADCIFAGSGLSFHSVHSFCVHETVLFFIGCDCSGSGDAPGVAWVRGDAGQPSSSEIKIPVCRPCTDRGKATSSSPLRQGEDGHGEVGELVHVSKFQAREPGDPVNTRRGREATPQTLTGRLVNVSDGNAKMNIDRKSDGSVVPAKSANKGGSKAPAEWM
jgi:hypothetical protein